MPDLRGRSQCRLGCLSLQYRLLPESVLAPSLQRVPLKLFGLHRRNCLGLLQLHHQCLYQQSRPLCVRYRLLPKLYLADCLRDLLPGLFLVPGRHKCRLPFLCRSSLKHGQSWALFLHFRVLCEFCLALGLHRM